MVCISKYYNEAEGEQVSIFFISHAFGGILHFMLNSVYNNRRIKYFSMVYVKSFLKYLFSLSVFVCH